MGCSSIRCPRFHFVLWNKGGWRHHNWKLGVSQLNFFRSVRPVVPFLRWFLLHLRAKSGNTLCFWEDFLTSVGKQVLDPADLTNGRVVPSESKASDDKYLFPKPQRKFAPGKLDSLLLVGRSTLDFQETAIAVTETKKGRNFPITLFFRLFRFPFPYSFSSLCFECPEFFFLIQSITYSRICLQDLLTLTYLCRLIWRQLTPFSLQRHRALPLPYLFFELHAWFH